MEDKKEKVVSKKQVEEKKEKKSNKKILLLLLLLILTGVLLSTSTFAWFTSNRTVTVEDINVNVAASSGIQISVDGSSWKSIITNADLEDAHLTYANATNQIPDTLRPVSTAAASLTNGYLSMWLGTVSTSETTANKGQYILSTQDVSSVKDNSDSNAGDNEGESGNFVMFDLFIRLDDNSSADPQTLYLTNGSNVVIQQNSSDLGTQNSARIAFINEGDIATGSSLGSIQGLVTTSGTDIYVWEPNYDAHTATGLSNAYSYYNNASSGTQYVVAMKSPAEQVPYFGTTGSVSIGDDVLLSEANDTDNASKFAAITPGIATEANWSSGTAYRELFDLTPNKIVKMRVYFWIEGQDIDCENNASGGNIALKLQFSLNDHASNASGASTPTATPSG